MVEKIICAIMALVAVFSVNVKNSELLFPSCFENYTFYCGESSSNCLAVTLTGSDAAKFKRHKAFISGESVGFANNAFNYGMAMEIIDGYDASEMFCESADCLENRYYYSEKIDNFIVIKGMKVNIQLAITDNLISIGSPIIFGSY